MSNNAFIVIIVLLVLAVTYVNGQCSGTTQSLSATVTPQLFETPGYPVSYSAGLTCTWLIDSGTTGQPVLLYSNAFFLNCSVGDYVNIFDGSSITDTPLASNLCLNTVLTTEYISTDRYVLVQFVTDGAVSDMGFAMTYLSAADTSGTGCSTATNLTASSSPGYLTSVGFPNIYSGSSSCRWLITAPGDLSTITVQFEFSDIEFDSNCIYDKAMLYDGSYICENKILVTQCSIRTDPVDTPTTYSSTSNSLLVIFTSDSHDNYHGFVLKYTATIQYSTTTVTTVPTTTTTSAQCVPCASGPSAEQQQNKSDSNVYLMVVSGLSGAAFVILLKLTYSLIKYLKEWPLKTSLTVQSILSLAVNKTP